MKWITPGYLGQVNECIVLVCNFCIWKQSRALLVRSRAAYFPACCYKGRSLTIAVFLTLCMELSVYVCCQPTGLAKGRVVKGESMEDGMESPGDRVEEGSEFIFKVITAKHAKVYSAKLPK